jgi:iron uptake system EfeUOB component EfeO/EfeM
MKNKFNELSTWSSVRTVDKLLPRLNPNKNLLNEIKSKDSFTLFNTLAQNNINNIQNNNNNTITQIPTTNIGGGGGGGY